jgi:hypothetical protein
VVMITVPAFAQSQNRKQPIIFAGVVGVIPPRAKQRKAGQAYSSTAFSSCPFYALSSERRRIPDPCRRSSSSLVAQNFQLSTVNCKLSAWLNDQF